MAIIQYFNQISKWGINPNDLYGSSSQASAFSGEQVVQALNYFSEFPVHHHFGHRLRALVRYEAGCEAII